MNDQEVNEKKKFIPKYKKYLYSIRKFERYPEMASEGVRRAIGYFAWIIFIFAIIMSIGLIIKMHISLKSGIEYLDNNFSEISYSEGILNLQPSTFENGSSYGNMIINTGELTEEQARQFEEQNTSNKLQIIWLKNRVIAKVGDAKIDYYYKDIFDKFEMKEFDKAKLIGFLNNKLINPKTYLVYALIIIIYTFIVYFITTFFDIFILSIFGMITSAISGIKLRYRAIFNMSIYAFTISITLQLIYLYINMFSDFNIKYFDLMYTTISFICLVAAIFMIKSDVIKQQLQLMKIIEIKKQESADNEQEEKKQEEEKGEEDKKENESEKKEKGKDGEEKNPDGELGTSAQCQSVDDLNNRKEC